MFRYLLFTFGLLASLPLIGLLLFVPRTSVSSAEILYLLSYFLIVLGMTTAPWWPDHSTIFILIGSAIGFLTLMARVLFPPAGTHVNLITLPGQSGPRVLNRIFNEQDIVLFGAQLAPYFGAISPSEQISLDLKFGEAFKEMSQEGVTSLSPFLTTYLNRQHPDEFDVVIAEPRSGVPPKRSILFLHGFGGNFTVQCWLIARAGNQLDALTVCPSTRVNGDWWSPAGEATLQETLTYLEQRGIERIYLAGLSNGAIGASRLAEKFENRLTGLILISGADPSGTITELPVLVLHGKYDERIPVDMMEGYVSAAGPHAAYHLFEGDHFLLLKQADEVQEVILNWLSQQEANFRNN